MIVEKELCKKMLTLRNERLLIYYFLLNQLLLGFHLFSIKEHIPTLTISDHKRKVLILAGVGHCFASFSFTRVKLHNNPLKKVVLVLFSFCR